MNTTTPQVPQKLTPLQFTLKAIEVLRTGQYKGIHSVYSGFNAAFRKYFNTDPIVATKQLSESGKIAVRFARGGAILYNITDAPVVGNDDKSNKALASILAS
jgi:hypothetical protein